MPDHDGFERLFNEQFMQHMRQAIENNRDDELLGQQFAVAICGDCNVVPTGDHGGLEEENAQLRAALARERTENDRLKIENVNLRIQVKNISWYDWLGQWFGRVGSFVADICTLDGVMRLFRNRMFMSQLAAEISELFGSCTMTVGGVSAVTVGAGVMGTVVTGSIGYWLYTTEDKQAKMAAFGRGVRKGFVNFPIEVRDKLGQLYDKILELIDRYAKRKFL